MRPRRLREEEVVERSNKGVGLICSQENPTVSKFATTLKLKARVRAHALAGSAEREKSFELQKRFKSFPMSGTPIALNLQEPTKQVRVSRRSDL
jgi:hypothetical protein